MWKERLLKFEALRGVVMVLGGVPVIYLSIYHIQYILQAFGALCGVYCVVEGLYQIFYNPIERSIKFEAARRRREVSRQPR